MNFAAQQRPQDSTFFQRACAILCLFLLMFSVAHTVFGHSDALTLAMHSGASSHATIGPPSPDTPDACALCVAMATVVMLAAFFLVAPRRTRPRPPIRLLHANPLTGWHASLFCRPPPAR